MSEDRGQSLWERFKRWWQKPPTAIGTLVLGLVAVALAAILATLAGLLLHFFGPSGHVSGYVLISVACLSLILGGLGVAWPLNSLLREKIRVAEAEREREQAKLTKAAQDHETIRRLGIYQSHVYNLIEALIAGSLSFEDLGGEEASQFLCEATELHLKEASGEICCVSIWMEPKERGSVREAIQGALSYLPGELGRKFDILAAPGQRKPEQKKLEVEVDTSWLDFNYRVEQRKDEVRVYSQDHLDEVPDGPPDLDVFKEEGYRSVRAVSFKREDQTGYIVVVSKAGDPFTNVEATYFLWLRHAIELDEALRCGPDSAAGQQSST
jgi:hypothetical protein